VRKKGPSGARPTGPNLGLAFKLLALAGPENRPSVSGSLEGGTC
jgi:hypothetical protein